MTNKTEELSEKAPEEGNTTPTPEDTLPESSEEKPTEESSGETGLNLAENIDTSKKKTRILTPVPPKEPAPARKDGKGKHRVKRESVLEKPSEGESQTKKVVKSPSLTGTWKALKNLVRPKGSAEGKLHAEIGLITSHKREEFL